MHMPARQELPLRQSPLVVQRFLSEVSSRHAHHAAARASPNALMRTWPLNVAPSPLGAARALCLGDGLVAPLMIPSS